MNRLDEEREAQKAWRPKRPEVGYVVEEILRREFLPPQEARDLEAHELRFILHFAKSVVPFYQSHDRWKELDLSVPVDRDLLAELPILTKHDVRDEFDALKARQLPKGEKVFAQTSSSGTTGEPTKVLFSQHAALMFGLLAQRLYRWARCDPGMTQAVIRLARDLPRQRDGSLLPDNMTHRSDSWMYVKNYFHTGPQIAISRSNSVEAQIEWLRKERPQYLVTFPGTLETLVYACQGKPVDSLLGLRTISATLTDGMRNQIESATRLPVHQGYGLNEIGIVAHRCEAGRYHVNAEHCVVEIVNEAGKPCKAGETGRIVVTGLTNFAMPLIRYDTGDLGEAVEGACDCGRTLPGFGRILGRYRAMRHTPEGTSRRVNLVMGTINDLPLDTLSRLREYQLHQYRDDSFELRLLTEGEPDERLVNALLLAWSDQANSSSPLRIVHVDKIPPAPGGKQQDFTSDFFPAIHERA